MAGPSEDLCGLDGDGLCVTTFLLNTPEHFVPPFLKMESSTCMFHVPGKSQLLYTCLIDNLQGAECIWLQVQKGLINEKYIKYSKM